VRQWRKVGLMVERGLLFHSCGCSGPGPRPRTLGDAQSEFGLRRSARRHHAPATHYRGRRVLMPS
jgi:hypothetical protein